MLKPIKVKTICSFQDSGDVKEDTPNTFQIAPTSRKMSSLQDVNRKAADTIYHLLLAHLVKGK